MTDGKLRVLEEGTKQMKDYLELRNKLLEFARVYAGTGNTNTNEYRLATQAASAIDELCVELRTCRNELCLKCGDYKFAHKGACDGCRWKNMGD